MTKKDVVVRLDSGLETRPVALLVQMASQFESEVYIESRRSDIQRGYRNMQKKNRKLRIGSFLFFCILQHNGEREAFRVRAEYLCSLLSGTEVNLREQPRCKADHPECHEHPEKRRLEHGRICQDQRIFDQQSDAERDKIAADLLDQRSL